MSSIRTSHFYCPDLDESVLSVLEPSDACVDLLSEKRDTRVTDETLWQTKTVFGLAFGWLDASQRMSIVVCDDRETETADFYVIDDVTRRVRIIHAKVEEDAAGVSARELQDVTRQAQTASLSPVGAGGPLHFRTTGTIPGRSNSRTQTMQRSHVHASHAAMASMRIRSTRSSSTDSPIQRTPTK